MVMAPVPARVVAQCGLWGWCMCWGMLMLALAADVGVIPWCPVLGGGASADAAVGTDTEASGIASAGAGAESIAAVGAGCGPSSNAIAARPTSQRSTSRKSTIARSQHPAALKPLAAWYWSCGVWAVQLWHGSCGVWAATAMELWGVGCSYGC